MAPIYSLKELAKPFREQDPREPSTVRIRHDAREREAAVKVETEWVTRREANVTKVRQRIGIHVHMRQACLAVLVVRADPKRQRTFRDEEPLEVANELAANTLPSGGRAYDQRM